jgi:hypothetical protein
LLGRRTFQRSIEERSMNCPPCKGCGVQVGTTTIPCELCGGAGLLSDERLANPVCAFCKGSGISRGTTTILCSVCSGWGRLATRVSGGVGDNRPIEVILASLRQTASTVTSQQARTFIEEAIGCAEARFHRAAIVLSWAGAVSVLHDHVVVNHLEAFNAEARRRDQKWRAARSADDLSRMKEHDLLDVLEAISVIVRNVKTELQGCLKLRNGCGHPSSLQVSEHRTAAHIETLVLNVFASFSNRAA